MSAADVPWLNEYEALTRHAGIIELPRTRIELTGSDRVQFLHNLCTNDIRKLAPGRGCEAFLTTVQGKTLAHVFVFARPESLVIDTVPGQAETILKHLDHYLVSEQVTLVDRSDAEGTLFLSGPESPKVIEGLISAAPPQQRLSFVSGTIAGRAVEIARVELAGPIGFLTAVARDSLAALRDAIVQAGVSIANQAAFEAARIEWGFPLFGADITAGNLPQEVARDRQAISFVKGCYLGQETVARIDALGHVNKTLVGIRLDESTIPQSGDELLVGGQPAAQITSATYSPREGRPLSLGYVRRGSNVPGSRLTSAQGDAEVIALAAAQ